MTLGNIKLPLDALDQQAPGILAASGSNSSSNPNHSSDAPSAISSTLPSKPKSLEPWDILKKEVDLTPNDISLWDKLFALLEETFTTNFDGGQASISPSFKSFAFDAYTELLTRFPYLTSYWKKFLIFEYKLNGIDASIKVLSDSVDSFPNSISLWADYLTALTGKEEGDSDHVDFVRTQFQVALKINGFHFLSHLIWDKLFEFEEKLGGDPFWLYLKVIKIPLYSYAKYYQKFTEINKKYTLEEFFSAEPEPSRGEIIQEYLTKFNKETLDSFSMVETHQVIDDWSYKVFAATQAKVNAKWQYESLLTFPEFNLDAVSLEGISKEYDNWVTYINYEISCLKEDDSRAQRKIVTNLFERALIPNCLNYRLWLKYIAFLNKYESEGEEENLKFEKIDKIYSNAINKFVPLSDPKEDTNFIRFNYVYFLKSFKKDIEARDFLISIVQTFQKEYRKEDYLKGIELLIDLCDIDLNEIIEKYFHLDDRHKQAPNLHKEPKVESSPIQDVFYNLLSNDSIGLIVNKYLINLDPSIIRPFFNKYYEKEPLESNLAFWSFYVKFEGIIKHNIPNLLKIMSHIKKESKLPKQFIDALIEIEYDIILSNYQYILELNNSKGGRTDDTIILKDNEVSNSLAINQSWKNRLANINFQVQDLSTKTKFNKEDEFNKILRNKVGHAGVVIESSPEITNSLIYSGKWIDLNSSKLEMPDFPTFKNVEKASLPIQYPQ